MNFLSLENITKAYTERVLLDKASFFLQEGEKVGIIIYMSQNTTRKRPTNGAPNLAINGALVVRH